MKKICWTASFVALCSAAAAAQVTQEEVRRFVEARLPDDVIVAFIRFHGAPARVSADDLVGLRSAGASDRVLAALLPEGGSGKGIPVLYDRVAHCWIDLNCRKVAWGPTASSAAILPTPGPLPVCHPRCLPKFPGWLSFRR